MSRRAAESIYVIYVDADSEVANEVAAAITEEDSRFVVDAVERPDEALERLESSHIDCVVSDHEEGGIDGIELLESVREEYPDLPFVLFPSSGSEQVASDAISAGVTDYLRRDGSADRYAELAERVEHPTGMEFYVEDDGHGVPESDREHVFESGFTTSDEGTGFGLRIVEQIVDAHEWDIRVTERDGRDARFEISGVTFVE